jgi:hypothetical protein
MAEVSAIEKHQRQQEFSDLALSNKTLSGDLLGYEK